MSRKKEAPITRATRIIVIIVMSLRTPYQLGISRAERLRLSKTRAMHAMRPNGITKITIKTVKIRMSGRLLPHFQKTRVMETFPLAHLTLKSQTRHNTAHDLQAPTTEQGTRTGMIMIRNLTGLGGNSQAVVTGSREGGDPNLRGTQMEGQELCLVTSKPPVFISNTITTVGVNTVTSPVGGVECFNSETDREGDMEKGEGRITNRLYVRASAN